MKHTLQQIFRSPKFLVGFSIFMTILLIVLIYPLFITDSPLKIIGQGTFFPPGIYVSAYDSLGAPKFTLNLTDAAAKRVADKLGDQERADIRDWLVADGIPETEIDIHNTEKLLEQWAQNYDPNKKIPGMTFAKQRYYQRLDESLKGLLSKEGAIIAQKNTETGALEEAEIINQTDYVNIDQVASVRVLPLGTDNFGRDVLTELVAATRTSLQIGLVAGLVATLIGLTLGLLAGYIGGTVDDIINFVTNLFIVIPSFVLLILISYSVGQESRGAFLV